MPAPNSMTYSSMSDWLVAEVLDGNVVELLAERNNLPMHPAFYLADRVDARGSNVVKVTHVGLRGYDLPTSISDGGSVGLTALSDGSSTISVTRYTKAYGWTDLVRMVLPDGRLDPNLLALDAVVSANSRLTDLIVNITDNFTATAGPGSGTDLDTASLLATVGAAAVANFGGRSMGVLHGQQYSDWIVDGGTSIGSAGGGTQNYNPELAAIQQLKGDGYIGPWAGIDWFRNNRVPTANAGADRAGAIFSHGSVLIAQGEFRGGVVEDPVNQVYLGSDPSMGLAGTILLERARDAFSGETAFVMHVHYGVSLGVQAGITIQSDA